MSGPIDSEVKEPRNFLIMVVEDIFFVHFAVISKWQVQDGQLDQSYHQLSRMGLHLDFFKVFGANANSQV